MNKCKHCGSNEVKIHFNAEDGRMLFFTDCYNKLMAEELEVDLEPDRILFIEGLSRH